MKEKDLEAEAAPKKIEIVSSFFNKLYRILNLIISKWWVLLLCIAASIGARLTFEAYSPPSFESTGRMIVGNRSSLPDGGGYSEEMNNFYGTQRSLMQSETVSNRVMAFLETNSPNLKPCPTKLNVKVTAKTSIFNLQLTSQNAEYSERFLGSLMTNYMLLKQEMRDRSAVKRQEALSSEITSVQNEIDRCKANLATFESTNSLTFLQERAASMANYLTELTRQVSNDKSELELLQKLSFDENVDRQLSLTQRSMENSAVETKDVRSSATQVPVSSEAGSVRQDTTSRANADFMSTTGEYLKAKQDIALSEQKYKDWSRYFKSKHPTMQALADEISRKKQLLDVFKGQSQEQLKSLQHALELKIENTGKQIHEWETNSQNISKKLSEYQTLKEAIGLAQTKYERMSGVALTLETDRSLSQDSVGILEPASPGVLVKLHTGRWIAIAGVLGLLLGIGILLAFDSLDDRPTSLAELQDVLDEEVLGQIPKVRTHGQADPELLKENDDRHGLMEAYRNLRSSIMFLRTPEKNPHILLVTSAIPSDGKSMTSANLAIVLARAGSKVLLVDADLRRGVMHRRFHVEAENGRSPKGFSEVLSETCKWTDVLIQTSTPNLTLIARGSTKHHPGDLFVSASKDNFLKDIAGKYDYIVFDTAPVMAADDVSNLAPYVDGVIMVVRANHTSGRVARAAREILARGKANILGVVFNSVRTHNSDYYYYHYKDYYGKNPTN